MIYDKTRRMYLPDTVRPKNSGYGDAGASFRKRALKGFLAQSRSPAEDIDQNNYTLRQRARMLYMSTPVAASAVKTNRTNVVGVGLRLKSRPNRETLGLTPEAAQQWQKRTEREFSLWAEDKKACDATGVNNFYGMQQLALTSWLLSGDCFGVIKYRQPGKLTPYGLRIHLVEADRVRTPMGNGVTVPGAWTTGQAENGNSIYDGVEVDQDGMIAAYYVCNHYPFSYPDMLPDDWVRIPAYGERTGLPNVLHLMDSERPDQYRGVSYLAQIIEPMLQLRRYTDSELTAALVQSFFSAFITTEANPSAMPYNEPMGEDQEPVSSDPDDYEMGPGTINIMKPGEGVQFANPTRPNSGFDAFTHALCEQMGAALEIPVELLLKSFNSSYSASRAALLEAWKAFKMRREWFVADFCRPVYELWLSEAVARGRIQAPGFFTDPAVRSAWLGSEWIGPSQGQIDPVKEITAEILANENGYSTREQSTIRLNGGQWEANVEQLRRENEKLSAVTDQTGERADSHEEKAAIEAAGKKTVTHMLREVMNDG